MKFNLSKRRKYLLAGGLLLATATPSFALFGIGDIVFDPTSYASLVSQLTTLESQYNMLKNNVTHFSFKQQWQTTLNALKNANVANMFGETAAVNIALNSNSDVYKRQHKPRPDKNKGCGNGSDHGKADEHVQKVKEFCAEGICHQQWNKDWPEECGHSVKDESAAVD